MSTYDRKPAEDNANNIVQQLEMKQKFPIHINDNGISI
jgi:hypothetical protein